MRSLSKYFVNGLILLAPIAITLVVILEIFSVAEMVIGRYLPVYFPGLSLILVMILIVLIGWLSSNLLLKKFIGYGERALNNIPVIKFIYNTVKKLSAAVFESQNLFNQAVLVNYPSGEIKTLGFIINTVPEPLAGKLKEEHVCVFIPFSVNMTAGVNIIVPKRDIIQLDVTSESALQYILTAGSVMPSNKD